jgi:glycosyltransferase involved in cell wall biosynthesis
MIKQGHEVHVFSSDSNPAGDKFSKYTLFEGIHIHRFPVNFKIGNYALFFKFDKELKKLKPDIIHTHGYRTPYSTRVAYLSKQLNIPCILTTHAPFERKRGIFLDLFAKIYDMVIGKKLLNSYSKVIAITKWEISYLVSIGCKEKNVEYIPNGVSEKLIVKIKRKKGKKALYLGRVSEIKNLEIIVDAAAKAQSIKFKIFGPFEKGCLINKRSNNLEIINKSFDLKKEIELFEDNLIYILPSKSEGFPQTLIESMAAGLIAISSPTKGGIEIIKDGKNGFIFHSINDLIKKINSAVEDDKKSMKIRINAQATARNFLWRDIVKKIEDVYSKNIK